MAEAERSLVLWDIDRTLLYVGEIDRQVYRETFAEVVGCPVDTLSARGTGVTMPVAIRTMLVDNGVPEDQVPELLRRMTELLPKRLATHTVDLRQQGRLMPGAVAALKAVRGRVDLVPSVVTGNLKASAELKLAAFGLDSFVDTTIGGYASDDHHRPALVGIAQKRAQDKYGVVFDRSNSVIIGDSLEDVRTGRDGGGVPVIGIASGTTSAADLERAGADVVLPSLEDVGRLETAISELLF
ncbi:HAD family hydrolase [Streptomyces gibsoniae]|uniref:Haloacid dehalogenase-like hydrolase n=1 Tax=Streptomyces gibsoniae TaxID=3075529 RepID=A0ABU2TVF7_9ACTN|nr:haloacid dehalogenase-like hydrolase [Streptomyces sp. DSM 41699]MDT0464806.1 haloacid dehalogenase-like hydrolase [Streptomyces sp. DSM 41699]